VSGRPVHFSVVIPAFNEASRIVRTLEELRTQLPAHVDDWEIRVVDDGSTDDTATIVEAVAAQDARVVLQREPHRGKGGTVRAGLLASPGALRFMCDADLSMPVAEIPRFLAVVPSQCEIAIGSREGVGARRVGEPGYRHVMGRVFNGLVKASVLPGLNDTQCGFKLFTARAVETVFPQTTIDGWAFDIEALFIATRRGLVVKELPVEWHYRDRSQVSPFSDPFRMMRDVWQIRLNALRGRYDR
jgi:glycosyltransferase involved in cell wall biosynthesis